jgi:hypothetical protein
MTVRPVTRTAERAAFLGDIITGAVEGGIGYWSQTSQYQYEMDGEIHRCVGRLIEGGETRATIHVVNDDETGYEDEGLTLDLDAVERGLKLIREGGVKLTPRHRNTLLAADRGNEADRLDALDCDIIVQLGLFGELVYA